MQEMWKFKELETGMPERDPRETEFFRLPGPSEVLVREIIQNSLDAKRNDEPWSQVRFTFGSVKRREIDQYLDGLIPHLAACELNLPDLTREASLHFLTIEDFGTTGLDGATGALAPGPLTERVRRDPETSHFSYCYKLSRFPREFVQMAGDWTSWSEFFDRKETKNDPRIIEWLGKKARESNVSARQNWLRPLTKAIHKEFEKRDTTVFSTEELFERLEKLFV
jgi:hypothetical protein